MLCQRCHDIVLWRINYRKYKPLSGPTKCNVCDQRSIIKAYRALCDHCSLTSKPGEKLCTKCGVDTLQIDLETGKPGPGYAIPTLSKKAKSEAKV